MNAGQPSFSNPWVTFCMTTYRRPDFLHQQLTALSKQTFPHFRVVISDNDPSGSARATVEAFNDPRVSYYVNEVNLGMVKSFNRSLAKAETEYVVMITDDDPVYPDMLQTLYNLTLQYPGYGMYMGGCDIMCYNPEVARSSRLRVGTNSCLANLPIGTVRQYEGKDFPHAYFSNAIGCHLLWSCGVVKREVAMAIEGMPDFGAPYNTDFGYIVLSGAQQGALLLNTSLGCQVVHGANYGFTESDYDKFYVTPDNFMKWVMDHLPKDHDFSSLQKTLVNFTARWVVEYAVSIKKIARDLNVKKPEFDKVVNKIFKIPYLRKWKIKYILAIHFPGLFEFLIGIKNKLHKA
ncbi:MAG TPA: glycosyltransferase [Pseudobacter sp.]|jgi:glycosyltransferase involved in cell wall biosynthesis|nr:glycosyltransferase [Pseudobacter sp.]